MKGNAKEMFDRIMARYPQTMAALHRAELEEKASPPPPERLQEEG